MSSKTQVSSSSLGMCQGIFSEVAKRGQERNINIFPFKGNGISGNATFFFFFVDKMNCRCKLLCFSILWSFGL